MESSQEATSLKGQFIMAMPGLKDPNFHRTVSCIAEQTAEGGMGLVVNRLHPFPEASLLGSTPDDSELTDGRQLLLRLAERERSGLAELEDLLGNAHPVAALPLLEKAPTDLASLAGMAATLEKRVPEKKVPGTDFPR